MTDATEYTHDTEPEDPEDQKLAAPYQDVDKQDEEEPGTDGPLTSLPRELRTYGEALTWAKGQHLRRSRTWTGLCLIFVRSCFNVGSRYPSAETGYFNSNERHTSWPPPAGVPVWWTNGRNGHVVISAGNGWCWSTDFKRTGYVDLVRIASIAPAWGQRYRGWTADVNEVKVWEQKTVTLPKVDVSNVAHATKNGDKVYWGRKLKAAVALEVGKGSMDLTTSILGGGFRDQYKLVQKKYIRATGGSPNSITADGIPGMGSMKWLSRRHGFTAV